MILARRPLHRAAGTIMMILVVSGCSAPTEHSAAKVLPKTSPSSTKENSSTTTPVPAAPLCQGRVTTLNLAEQGLSGGQYVFTAIADSGKKEACSPSTGVFSWTLRVSGGKLLAVRDNPLRTVYTATKPYPPAGTNPTVEWENWCGARPTVARPFVLTVDYAGATGHLTLDSSSGVPLCLGRGSPSVLARVF
jgi:hypothetical protein